MESEISEGLRQALSKGETIEQAKRSFVNAGYSQEDVETAARMINTPVQEMVSEVKEATRGFFKPKPLKAVKKIEPSHSVPQKPASTISNQKVSNYENKPKTDFVLILMLSILFFLIVVLGLVYFFKAEVVEFISNLFS